MGPTIRLTCFAVGPLFTNTLTTNPVLCVDSSFPLRTLHRLHTAASLFAWKFRNHPILPRWNNTNYLWGLRPGKSVFKSILSPFTYGYVIKCNFTWEYASQEDSIRLNNHNVLKIDLATDIKTLSHPLSNISKCLCFVFIWCVLCVFSLCLCFTAAQPIALWG